MHVHSYLGRTQAMLFRWIGKHSSEAWHNQGAKNNNNVVIVAHSWKKKRKEKQVRNIFALRALKKWCDYINMNSLILRFYHFFALKIHFNFNLPLEKWLLRELFSRSSTLFVLTMGNRKARSSSLLGTYTGTTVSHVLVSFFNAYSSLCAVCDGLWLMPVQNTT